MLLILFAAVLLPFGVLTYPSDILGHIEPLVEPVLQKLHVDSYVRNRYARTIIQAQYKNIDFEPREVFFSMVLPDQAFITEFIMIVNNKEYKGYVREKDAAKREYNAAVQSGLGAAHVAASLRDSNEFIVSVNVDALKQVSFNLTYEHLIEKKRDMYELVIHLDPSNQIVEDFSVNVNINETRPIVNVQVPEIENENAIFDIINRNNYAVISDLNAEGTEKQIVFTPTTEQQKGTNYIQRFTGRFIVRYKVDSNSENGELITSDGHFVHFFSPENEPPLDKNVIFVLDTSYSMMGEKIQQLRRAMEIILGECNENDYFSVVTFNSDIEVLQHATTWKSIRNPRETNLPNPIRGTLDNIYKAQKTISNIKEDGMTNIEGALIVALRLANMKNINHNGNILKPIIIFLTDGHPNVGQTNPSELIQTVKSLDTSQTAIFTLAFGNDADENFLTDLATNNYGFMRKIYIASDTEMQLKTFYNEISSPLLTNIHFKYDENELTNVTKTYKHTIFKGSEFVTAGVLNKLIKNKITVEGLTKTGLRTYRIKIKPSTYKTETKKYGSTERLWAYLTIKKLLENKKSTEAKKKALDLALKYSFVTPITSLVVVKPNGTEEVDLKKINVVKDKNVNIGNNPISTVKCAIKPPPPARPTGFVAKTHSLSTSTHFSGTHVFDFIQPRPIMVPELAMPIDENTLVQTFPWINPYVRNKESVLINNTIYFVGDETTNFDYQSCKIHKDNKSGQCTLLTNCDKMISKLVSFDTYVNNYMCTLKMGRRVRYLGVCCED